MLSGLKNWELVNNESIKRVFAFTNFRTALDFVNKVGELAEEYDHHPDIHLFDYKKVRVVLTTHSAGGVTEKDTSLAKEIDKLVSE